MNAETVQHLPNGGRNIIPLPAQKQKRQPIQAATRFKIKEFTNRSGSQSWRVSGIKRDGSRVRENFQEQGAARVRQIELETEYLTGQAQTEVRATKLTDDQVRLAEMAVLKLGEDWERLLDAAEYWQKHGRQNSVSNSPRLDDAVTKFKEWLDSDADCDLREHSRKGLRLRVDVFSNSIGNFRVNEISVDEVENFLNGLKISAVSRDNYRRAVSRFFSWCIDRPRRWTMTNPCKEIRIRKEEKAAPAILTVPQCKALLKSAEGAGLAPYVSVCLFAGLRPFEASRLEWSAVNLKDREIRLEGVQTKTGRPRVVTICNTLFKWLKAHEGKAFFPSNWRKRFAAVKASAGITAWPVDVMRHTAISHYFRKTGSYGRTAEQFGNSEGIIKAHYQGRVSSEDTKRFYAIRPMKGGGK